MRGRQAEPLRAHDAARFLVVFTATTGGISRTCRPMGGKSGLFCLRGAFGAGPLDARRGSSRSGSLQQLLSHTRGGPGAFKIWFVISVSL